MRRIIVVCALAVTIIVSANVAAAQGWLFSPLAEPGSVAPAAQKDADAQATLQAAVNALGGASSIGQAQSWRIVAAKQTPASINQSTAVSYEVSGTEFRVESPTAAGSHVLVTGHGEPTSVNNGNAISIPPFYISAMVNPILIAPLLLQELQDPARSCIYHGVTSLAQRAAIVIDTVSPATTGAPAVIHTWYFDSSTKLPVRLEYRTPVMTSSQITFPGTLDFSSFRGVGGTLYPYVVVLSQVNRRSVLTVESIDVNPTIPTSDFDPPSGGAQ
jgi:hypothetical protein